MLTRDLTDLRAKYEEILRLRLLHGTGDEPDPRRAMAALAGRFPGALRELDDLPLPEIRARIEALRAAFARFSSVPSSCASSFAISSLRSSTSRLVSLIVVLAG